MSDITEIEAEARDYANSHPSQGLPGYRYLVAMLAVVDGLRAEIARLSALPGADAGDKADELLCAIDIRVHPLKYSKELREITVRALQQYGGERAREARESAIERCAEWHDLLAEQINSTGAPNEGREERLRIEANWHREMAKAFRSGGALAPEVKPQPETPT